jgi:hypothetical protein
VPGSTNKASGIGVGEGAGPQADSSTRINRVIPDNRFIHFSLCIPSFCNKSVDFIPCKHGVLRVQASNTNCRGRQEEGIVLLTQQVQEIRVNHLAMGVDQAKVHLLVSPHGVTDSMLA